MRRCLRSSARRKLRPTAAVAFSAATALAQTPPPELHLLRSSTPSGSQLSNATLRSLLQSLRIHNQHFVDALFLLVDMHQTGCAQRHNLLILYSLFRELAFTDINSLRLALHNVLFFVFHAAAGSDATASLTWPQWIHFASKLAHHVGGPDSLPCEQTAAQMRSAWPTPRPLSTPIRFRKFVTMLRKCDGGLLFKLRAMAFIFVSAVVEAAHTLHQMPPWHEPVEDNRFLSHFLTHIISTRVNASPLPSALSPVSSFTAESTPQPRVHIAKHRPHRETEHQSALQVKYFQDRQPSSSSSQKPLSFQLGTSSPLTSKALASFSATVSRSIHSKGKTPFHIDFSSLKLGEKLGSGSYGEVFKGTFLMTPVAVKLFHINIQRQLCDSTKNASTLSRMSTMQKLQRYASIGSQNKYRDFVREVEMMSLVRHPNLVLYMGACGDPLTRLCIVSELFAGSLYDYLHSDPDFCPDAYVAVSISLCVARGMFYLHSSKPSILHRDLKSKNVLRSDRKGTDGVPHVVICDFGQSQLFGHEGEYELGTASYMSPNVINTEEYEERDDTYSFGILLHEIFTGTVPYEGMSSVEIMFQVANESLRPKCDRDDGIPEDIRRLIEECWNEDKQTRPLFDSIISRLELFEANMISRKKKEAQRLVVDPPDSNRFPQLDDSEFLKKLSVAASSVSSQRAVSPQPLTP